MEQKIKILLISGAENTGKTSIIRTITDWLEYKNFTIIKERYVHNFQKQIDRKQKNDYFCIAEKNDNNMIIISTASDRKSKEFKEKKDIIHNFGEYIKKNLDKSKNIFIITAIRNKQEIAYKALKELIKKRITIRY